MRKRLLASLMAMVLLLSLFPISALAVERDKGSETPVACAVTEGCTLQAGHECECVLPDEPETTEDDPADVSGGDYNANNDTTEIIPDQEEPGEELTAAEQVAAMIAALPAPEDIDPEDEAQMGEVYNQISYIYAFAEENGIDVKDNAAINAVTAALYPVKTLDAPVSDDVSWKSCKACSEDNPHMISTTAELDKIRTHIDSNSARITGYFKLTNDIAFKDADFQEGGAYYNQGAGWIPLDGVGWAISFAGTLDGAGHSIDGIISNVTSLENGLDYKGTGLFSCLTGRVKDLTLQNFRLYDSESSQREEAGALSGYVNGATIEDVTVLNSEIYGSRCGGIAGYAINSSFRDCTVQNVTIHSLGNCGGIIGAVRGGVTVENCQVGVSIQDIAGGQTDYHAYNGGIWGGQGFGDYSGKANTIKNVIVDFVYKSVNQGYVGGLIGGYHNNGSNTQVGIENAVITVDIEVGNCNMVGGIFGQLTSHTTLGASTLANVVVIGTIKSTSKTKTVAAIGRVPNSSQITLDKIYSNVTGTEQSQGLAAMYVDSGSPKITNSIFAGGENIEDSMFSNDSSYQKVILEKIKITYGDIFEKELSDTQGSPTNTDIFASESEQIIQLSDGKWKGVGTGETKISVIAKINNFDYELAAIPVTVTPMRIIYGKADTTQNDDGIGRPYITYALNENGTAPKFSNLLGFYPVKEGSQNGTFEADITKDKIDLKPGIGDDSDVYYVYQNDVSGNIIQTDTLPTHPTTDADGNPHSIRVELKLKNPNYRFCTVGTNWEPGDTIILYVTCYENGMNEVDLYLEGDSSPLETFEGDREYEYTGQGIVPTARDLTTLYTKGTNTDHSITSFTAHFHAVQEGTAFSGTHLYNQTNSQLTADALKAIAPTELGVYSFVINGYSKDTKTYCYASRRYSIVMGNPKGEPTFDKVSSGVELSTITLSGSMKNAAGIEVAGTFSWDDGDQTVERGKAYAWTFTPDDTDHYNKATGTAVVWPSSSGGGSSSGSFTVSVDSGKNGSVTVSPKRAEKGDTVTITVKPNEGYELNKLVVTGKNGGEIKLTNEGGGKYTFKMPASRVEIEASFAKIETEPKLPFADVSSGDWYYDAVVYVYKNGLMDGTGPAAFAPTTVLTRSMAAQVLWNLADSPAVPGTAGFTDVPSDAWYAGAVNWSAARGIVTGYSTGAFGPEDAVTREQLAAMLYRYAGTPEPTGSLDGFNDKDAVSDYAADALCWAVDEGLLTGKGGGWLDPAGTATRAEMAAILMRFTESHN